jgi:hypothetical protein
VAARRVRNVASLPVTVFGSAGLAQAVGAFFGTDAGWLSTDPTSSDFLALASGSACRGVGAGGLDLGAIPYGQQFPVDLSDCDATWDGSIPS